MTVSLGSFIANRVARLKYILNFLVLILHLKMKYVSEQSNYVLLTNVVLAKNV